MEYLKWMLVTVLLLGLFNTGLSKSTAATPDDYEEVPQDDEDEYADEETSKTYETVQNNDVTSSPPYFSVYNINVNASAGKNVDLHCDAKNLQDINVIMWYNGSQLIATDKYVINKDKVVLIDRTTIRIQRVEQNDQNQYICSILPHSVNLTIHLNVQKSRSVAIYSHARDVTERSITFRQGDKVEFECHAIGIENAVIKWSLNGERAANYVTKVDGGKVIIDSIDSHQAGTYQCLGDDGTKDLPHGSVTINVQYVPKVSTHRHYVNTASNDEAELYCDYKAEPIAIIEWKRHDGIIPTISDKYTVKNTIHKGKNRTILHVRDVNNNDLGEYECFARNAIGSAQVKIHLIYEPETPLLEDVKISDKMVTIHWLVRSKQPIVEAAVDYKLNGTHNSWMTASVSKTHPGAHTGLWKLTHDLELSPGKWHARMKVKNTYGWSKFSNEHDIIITEDRVEDIPPEDIVYAGGIAGQAKDPSSNSNRILMVPSFIILCLLPSLRIVVPLI